MSKDAEAPAAEEEKKEAAPKALAETKKAPAKATVKAKTEGNVNATNKAAKKPEAAKKAPASKAKKAVKEEEDIPMDSAAIKAYSSVIADAAEDSEPSTPVTYSAVIQDEEPQ